jgi:hypothetical protein
MKTPGDRGPADVADSGQHHGRVLAVDALLAAASLDLAVIGRARPLPPVRQARLPAQVAAREPGAHPARFPRVSAPGAAHEGGSHDHYRHRWMMAVRTSGDREGAGR